MNNPIKKILDVSRETWGWDIPQILKSLNLYEELLKKWQSKVNLIAPSTVSDIVSRHFLDSIRLIEALNPQDQNKKIIDIGTGAGFPGMVLAAMGFSQITLLDSDMKKTIFLQEVARHLGLNVKICNERIEQHAQKNSYDIVVSRACAPLTQLFTYAENLIKPEGLCYFLKGENYQKELTEAQEKWHILYEVISNTSIFGKLEGPILKIKEFKLK